MDKTVLIVDYSGTMTLKNDAKRCAMTCVCRPLLAAVEWLDQSPLSPGPIMGPRLTGDAPEAHA